MPAAFSTRLPGPLVREPLLGIEAQLLGLRDLGRPRRAFRAQRGGAIGERRPREVECSEQADHRHCPPEAPQQRSSYCPRHASLLDTAMPAVAVISTGLPTTARPTGQRRATQRDFSRRMMLTRSP